MLKTYAWSQKATTHHVSIYVTFSKWPKGWVGGLTTVHQGTGTEGGYEEAADGEPLWPWNMPVSCMDNTSTSAYGYLHIQAYILYGEYIHICIWISAYPRLYLVWRIHPYLYMDISISTPVSCMENTSVSVYGYQHIHSCILYGEYIHICIWISAYPRLYLVWIILHRIIHIHKQMGVKNAEKWVTSIVCFIVLY